MESEARQILQEVLSANQEPSEPNLVELIRARVEKFGGIDLEIPPRDIGREPPTFE